MMMHGRRLAILITLALVPACQFSDSEDKDDDTVVMARTGKVDVCHIPPGNPSNAHTINVANSAVPAHLAHGDHVGACRDGGACTPNAVSACYRGPSGTQGVGVCRAGTQTCNSSGTAYGACTGSIVPAAEVCGDGLDNDCDGFTDEGCVCTAGQPASCYDGPAGTEGVGACTPGRHVCNGTGTGYGACVGSIGPAPETCGNAIDDDCDAFVDEGCVCTPNVPAACYPGPAGTQDVGICHAGRRVCTADGSGYGACEGAIGPVDELCDGQDNDCDGIIDEGCIGDWAWSDTIVNDVQDSGEVGVVGVRFELYAIDPTTGDATAVDLTFSDLLGHYHFNPQPLGRYFIVAVPPPGWAVTSWDEGTNDDLDSDFHADDDFGYRTAPFDAGPDVRIDNLDLGLMYISET